MKISRCVIDLIRRAAAEAAPEEACGLLFGTDREVTEAKVTRNVAQSRQRHFEIDPAALFAALRAERAGARKLIGYWHSHPSGDAAPSSYDLEMAQDDGKLWVIIAGDRTAVWRVETSQIYEWLPDGRRVATGKPRKEFRNVPVITGEIRDLVPRDKSAVEIVSLIAEAGYPAIASILDDLMVWTADPNWPICVPLMDYLKTLGEPIVGPIRTVLHGSDDGHKFVCMRHMVRDLPLAARRALRNDLRILAETPCQGDWETSVDDEARAILAAMGDADA